MAASLTVHQLSSSLNSATSLPPLTPRHGVLTLFGCGISVRVDRGHLVVDDGIGAQRRHARFARIGHELRRLVVIGADGMISLAALRWLADQKAAFVMLNRDGTVLAVTGPVRPSDARLRRAQALAAESGVALTIVRELLDQKLAGQERVARESLGNVPAAEAIASARAALGTAEDLNKARRFEAQGAAAYWAAWQHVPVIFPTCDLRRVPEHWRTFTWRQSPLSGSPRLAVNPVNAILNYLYALLEAEARLAAAALGLDPGMGIMHVDTDARDSFACDLMEPVRPQVDAYLLHWIANRPIRREWFFEQRDGTCRLMGGFAAQLGETTSRWARAVAPVAEHVAAMLWASVRHSASRPLATPLTQQRRRRVHATPALAVAAATLPPSLCRDCGKPLARNRVRCAACAVEASKATIVQVAAKGRQAAHSKRAEARRADAGRRHAAARVAWDPASQPPWLTEDAYRNQIQPRLAGVTVRVLAATLGVSVPYATDVRSGRCIPHRRHWLALARVIRHEQAR